MSRILIVEDEPNISGLLKTHLEREGYQCFQAFDGDAALDDFFRVLPDLVILDLMLPGKNGLEVCRAIREKYDTYILMLTAKQEEIDKILGLELGADDYMTKPFSIRELLVRIKVLLRRPHLENTLTASGGASLTGSKITRGGLEIDPIQMAVKLEGRRILLTALEFDLLYFLVKNAGQVFKREQLLEQIWEDHSYVYDRNIDRIISQLRKKIETDPENPKKILTVWGVGYKFDAGA
ncbi:MAG TPA: response regulator transcription factor [Bacillota bacterium]|nr:response regulator transcription factor [Bacillota bacterium]